MKRVFCMLLVLLTCSCFSQKKIRLAFFYTIPYCGGARPTPEMEAKSNIKHPYRGKTIIFISEKGKTDSTKTDSKGNICLKLKPGTYKFYESWKFYRKTPNGQPQHLFDEACLRTEWEKEIYKVVISKKYREVTKQYDLLQPCDWQIECLLEKHMPE